MQNLIKNIKKTGEIYYPEHSLKQSISYPEDGYDSLFKIEENSFWFEHRIKVITHLVKQFSPKETLVDIGGGTGYTSYRLKNAGIDSLLIEPGHQGAFNASKRGVDAVCATIEELVFAPNALKAVGLFDVVEHIEDDLGFMKKVYAALADSAHVFITVPTYNFLWSDEDVHAGHFRRYTKTSFLELAQQAGFKEVFSSYFFQALILPIFLLRALPLRLGLKKEISHESTAADHNNSGLMVKLMNHFLDNEFKAISKGKSLSYGASLILVLQK